MHEARAADVRAFLGALQEELCDEFAAADGTREFLRDPWQRKRTDDALAGDGITAVLEGGALFERGGVGALRRARRKSCRRRDRAQSAPGGPRLPRHGRVGGHAPAQSPGADQPHERALPQRRRRVVGSAADSISPLPALRADAAFWHRAAAAACARFHAGLYAQLRQTCDEYFFLRHRGEARGIGGLFYDDLNEATPGFGMPWERCFEFMRAVGAGYLAAYREMSHSPPPPTPNGREGRSDDSRYAAGSRAGRQ